MLYISVNTAIGSRIIFWVLDHEASGNTKDNNMIKVYSAQFLAPVANMRNVLKMYQIESNITGEYLSAVVGEVPPIEVWPQLWVSEQDFERAKKIIEEGIKDSPDTPELLICPKCGEEVEDQFAMCWNCGATMN